MENESPLNLLKDSWLYLRYANGSKKRVSLAEIASEDFTDVVTPRADFRGATYQFLIGLLQTAFTPDDREQWMRYWLNPPDKNELEAAFSTFEEAFNLKMPSGEPAFMQDFDLSEGESKGVAQLLIEAPGGKTLRDNQDHFIKRGEVGALSPSMAALALFTLQINAPSGGVGHRVSLRGGGPLTTLVLPPTDSEFSTLWHSLWLNVLTNEELHYLPGNPNKKNLSDIFPWMGETRTSEKKGLETFPEHVNPLQHFWSMPRRIRLHWQEEGQCDLSGEHSDHLCAEFETRNYGVNYTGSWVHPLTPYSFEDGKESISIKGQPGGIGYRHWLGLVYGEEKGKQKRLPATVVTLYSTRYDWIRDEAETDFHPRLWAFGYDMDNMKARCWYESEMPIFNLGREPREEMIELAKKMIDAATDVSKTLKSSLKSAWFDRPGDAKGDLSFIDANFWSITEPTFYSLIGTLVHHLDDPAVNTEVLKQWRMELTKQAHQLFDQYALSTLNEDGDMRRAMKARIGKGGLEHYLNGSKALKRLTL